MRSKDVWWRAGLASEVSLATNLVCNAEWQRRLLFAYGASRGELHLRFGFDFTDGDDLEAPAGQSNLRYRLCDDRHGPAASVPMAETLPTAAD